MKRVKVNQHCVASMGLRAQTQSGIGYSGLRHEIVVIQRAGEQQQEKALQKRVKQLETAVAQLTLDKMVLEASLAEAEKLLGTNVKKTTNKHHPSLL